MFYSCIIVKDKCPLATHIRLILNPSQFHMEGDFGLGVFPTAVSNYPLKHLIKGLLYKATVVPPKQCTSE